MDFTGKTIALGITGGIAAYKACDLIRELYRRNAERVICIVTPSAQAFISPLSLQALSRQPVYTSELSVDASGVPMHIVLAQQADALLILPATANTIAKLAHGLADDSVTTTAISFTDKPVIVAPAMNTRMWRHPLTQANLHRLETLAGYHIIAPTSGHLACGETGEGHLAEQEQILQALARVTHPHQGLYQGVNVLVSAGGTQEAIDPVRVISNRSSGKMGLALADELAAMGAKVTLVTTRPPQGRSYTIIPVESAQEMRHALHAHFPEAHLLLMAAAVSDYTPADPSAQKMKREKQESLELTLVQNPDIIAELARTKKPYQRVVGFAAESQDLLAHAAEKLTRKNLDAIIANDISRSDIGFGHEQNEVTLLLPNHPPQPMERAPKDIIARRLLLAIHPLLPSHVEVVRSISESLPHH